MKKIHEKKCYGLFTFLLSHLKAYFVVFVNTCMQY